MNIIMNNRCDGFKGLEALEPKPAVGSNELLTRQATTSRTGSCASDCASEGNVGVAAAGCPGDHSEAGRWGCCGQDPHVALAEWP